MNRRRMLAMMLVALALPAAGVPERRAARQPAEAVLGVARISALDGDVRILKSNGDEFRATAGMEIFPDDALLTGAGSRAEVRLDLGNYVRLGGRGEVRFAALGGRFFRLTLVRGIVALSQMKRAEADLSLKTPLAAVSPLKHGRYTVEYRGDRTTLTIRDGQAEVFVEGRSRIVKDDSFSIRSAGGRVASLEERKSGAPSDFEVWAKRRDRLLGLNRRGGWLYPPF